MVNLTGRQRGITLWGILGLMGLLAFFALITLRLAPIYLEHLSVTGSLEALGEEAFVTRKSKGEIIGKLKRHFQINDVRNVKDHHITVKKADGRMIVAIVYEVRTKMFGNIDVVLSFSDEFEAVAH